MSDNEPIDIDDILAALAEDVSWEDANANLGIGKLIAESVEQKWLIPPDAVVPRISSMEGLPDHLLIKNHATNRQFLCGDRLEELSKLIPTLPLEDVDYHIIALGRGVPLTKGTVTRSFGFGTFIEYVIQQFGAVCLVDLSTLSMNPDHALMFLELLDSGLLARVRILIDRSLVNRKEDVVQALAYGFSQFPDSRVAVVRNHSKVCCITNEDSTRFCTITGSANLSGALRPENYVISTSPMLYNGYMDKFFNPVFIRG